MGLRSFARSLPGIVVAACVYAGLPANHACAADAAFQKWLADLWPAAAQAGRVARDLRRRDPRPRAGSRPAGPRHSRAGRTSRRRARPEFVLTPADYLKESSFDRLSAARAQAPRGSIATRSRASSASSACRPPIVLAIWGRETDYGRYKLPHDAIRVLATQGYVGRRKDFFRNEFLAALRMLQDGVPRAQMKSSWGGAMGLTQFLPSEFYKYAVDFDGDGSVDIWNSVPDALASAAKQLARQGMAARRAMGL